MAGALQVPGGRAEHGADCYAVGAGIPGGREGERVGGGDSMAVTKQIDWKPLHRILARRAMSDWGMTELDLAELQDLLGSGVTKEQIIRYVLDRFPNWSGRANELDVILDYAEAEA